MKFEVRPLSACTPIVNFSVALGLTFLVAACSGGESAPEPEADTGPEISSEIVELPAVWSTNALEKPVNSLAISGGTAPILAVAYEGSGLQLFDLDAERIGEIAPYSVRDLAAGHPVEIDGAGLTVFAGINSEGALKGYVFGEGLVAPVEVDLNVGESAPAEGICSSELGDGEEGLFRLAYWTEASDKFIHTGRLVEVSGEFTWLPDGAPSETASPLEACSFTEGGLTTPTGEISDAATLKRDGFNAIIILSESGAISAITDGMVKRLLISNGISVVMPDDPTAIAALGLPLQGGYGGGLIIAAGDVEGEARAVFIAADNLTGMSTSDQ